MTTATETKVKDPVCGMEINPAQAAGQREFGGATYYFCSDSCQQKFDADPAQYAAADTQAPAVIAAPAATDGASGERCDLPILGMHCAACATRIEKALGKAPGVQGAGVNYATGRATVHYDPHATDTAKLRDVVKNVGYDAIVPQAAPQSTAGHTHRG